MLGRDGLVRRFAGDSARLVEAILAYLVTPRSTAEILAHLSERAGRALALEGAVGEALAILEQAQAVVPVLETPRPASGPRRRLVLGIAGGIASAFAPGLVQLLLGRGIDVRVATTRNALRFVSSLALEALTHNPVVTSLWPSDPRSPVPHLELATWAELVVVHPATATSLSRIARGDCDDVVSATAVSARVPVVLVPSMNERMARAPSVMRNLDQLREDGFYVTLASSGFEVAERPDARAPMFGTAPSIGDVADIVSAVLAEIPTAPPSGATAWDEVYRSTPLERLAWFSEAVDDDILDVLGRVAPRPCRVLDLGAGPGTLAIEAARRGHGVVATDVSPTAVELAQRRAGPLPIAWLVDDVLETRVRGRFEVVHDRGCLHVLPESRHAAYAAAVGGLVECGGSLVLKVHHASEPAELGTHKFTEQGIDELLGQSFELVEARPSTFPGPDGRAPRALLCVLRRR